MFIATAIFISISLTEGDFRVTWTFEIEACSICHERQLETMKQFAAPDDQVIIVRGSSASEAKTVKDMIRDHFPDIRIEVTKEANMTTGFRIEDSFSGESFSYHSTGGSYNTSRASYLLRLFRDPVSRP